MRDAFSGIINIGMIVVFLVIVSGYLAYNVTYTKAFRVKNKIIDYIERYHKCEPGQGSTDACDAGVSSYMQQIGYSRDTQIGVQGASPAYTCENGYCVRCIEADTGGLDTKKQCYYDVVTAVNVDIPIINSIMPNMKIFQVSGSTQTFTCNPNVSCYRP